MKRIISALLTVFVFAMAIPVYAASDKKTDIEYILTEVKKKVDIPSELDEFESYYHSGNDKTVYNFEWSSKDKGGSVSVSCDENGVIDSYYRYLPYTSPGERQLASITKTDAAKIAKEFIAKLLPEISFEGKDAMTYCPDDSQAEMYGSGTEFRIVFERIFNGVIVEDNYVTVTIRGRNADYVVTDVNVSYDHSADFEEDKAIISDASASYRTAFPEELVYTKNMVYSKIAESKGEVQLLYRLKDNNIGYISAYTGDSVQKESFSMRDKEDGGSSMAADAESQKSGGGADETLLTEAEIAKLNEINDLISVDEAEKIARAIKELGIKKDMKLTGSGVFKRSDRYCTNLDFNSNDDENYSYAYICLDSKTGQLLSVNRYAYYKENSKSQKPNNTKTDVYKKKAEEFIKKYASSEFEQSVFESEDLNQNNYRANYVRVVGGINYISNGISISYDTKTNTVMNYSLNYDTDAEFPDAKNIVSADDAYKTILDNAPLKKVYVFSDGEYKLCFYPDFKGGRLAVNAPDGKFIGSKDSQGEKSGSYLDIDGHWCENTVKTLCEYGIALKGDKLEPDKDITQLDLLRLFAAATDYVGYIDYDENDIYEQMIRKGIIDESQKNPLASVTREDAFVMLIKCLGYNKIASIKGIYKTDFVDEGSVSDEHLGHIAILYGLGIINGNGNSIRAEHNITRAEALTLAYNSIK